MIILICFLLFTIIFYFYYRLSSKINRPLLLVMYVSTFYYAIAGPLYWTYAKDGYFLDVLWGEKITYAAVIMVAYSILYGFFISFSFFKKKSIKIIPHDPSMRPFWVLFGIATFSIIYVIIMGVLVGGLNRSNPLILIFYQFSDLFIPLLLYSLAMKRFSAFNIACLLVFTVYAVLVGFRYKLVLLYFPIILLLLGGRVETFKQLKRRIYGISFAVFILGLFALMTLTRKKFSGLDVSELSGVSSELAIYGLFAESNIIFGLLGVLSEFVDKNNYIFFEPVIDSILELIPKFILSGRTTGSYLMTGANGLVSEQAIQSGTAYPYFAEFLAMGGHFAAVLGIVLYSTLYRRYSTFCTIAGKVKIEYLTIGLGILAVFFGYYNFSRGYLPQSVKGFIFVVMPYFYLISRHYRKVGDARVGFRGVYPFIEK